MTDRTPTEKPRVAEDIRIRKCESKDIVILTANCVANLSAIAHSAAPRTDKLQKLNEVASACQMALQTVNKVGQ